MQRVADDRGLCAISAVLKIIMEAQGLHGLRYGDYQRYRQYCSRRMRRLRKGLNFLHWEQGNLSRPRRFSSWQPGDSPSADVGRQGKEQICSEKHYS